MAGVAHRRENGFGLVEVLIAAALGMGLLLALSNGMSSLTASSRKVESSLDLSGVKARVIEGVSCAKTMAAPGACATDGQYLNLLDERGKPLVEDTGTLMGRFLVLARCNKGTDGGIEVRAARLTSAGLSNPKARKFDAPSGKEDWFARDEVNSNLLYDWSHPKGLLLTRRSTSDGRLCREMFGGGPPPATLIRCTSPNQVMRGYDPVKGTADCVSGADMTFISSIKCPSGQYLEGIVNNRPVCNTIPTQTVVSGGGGGGGGGSSGGGGGGSSSPQLTWTTMGDQCNEQTANLPQCPVYSNVQGTSCSTLNAHCKSQFINDVSLCGGAAICGSWNCRRRFKCTP